jgi:hypothetical protein
METAGSNEKARKRRFPALLQSPLTDSNRRPLSLKKAVRQVIGERTRRTRDLSPRTVPTRPISAELNQVEAGERVVDLLHHAARREIAEVDHGEAASSNSATTTDLTSASSPERKVTR